MSKLFSVINLLNDNRHQLKVFTDNNIALSSVIINNAEKHLDGYLVNSFLLEHLYHQKVLHLIKEDSEEDMFPINYIINLIESIPFTTFLYREKVFNE